MKLPIFWLKDYIQVPEDLELLTDKLTAIGHMQDHKPQMVNGETVLDLEIRQNRSDCLSIIGLARELSAALDIKLSLPKSFEDDLPKMDNNLKINDHTNGLCLRFNTLSFEGLKIQKSPEWLSKKLEVYGIKSVNNLVDISNYVMIETGQPLHLFNSQDTKEIIIRKALSGENVIVLGEKSINLSDDDLIIASENEVLAIAGVIGISSKGIDENSSNITLESATYNQASIRRTTLRHDLRTEASLRNEKFLSPQMTEIALKRASELILEICGGKIVGHSDHYPIPTVSHSIDLDINEITRLGGIEIEKKNIEEIFSKLGITITESDENKIVAKVPYFRTDLVEEADLVEEILRIYGYNNIPERLLESATPKNIQSEIYTLEEKIRDLMIGFGFDEEITEPLTKEEKPQFDPIILENSLNSQKTMLRTTLKNNLFDVLKNRRRYRKKYSSIFEIGKIYFKNGNDYVEERTLGGIVSVENTSYLKVKGLIEVLLEQLGYKYSDNFIRINSINDSVSTLYFEINLEKMISTNRDLNLRVLTTPQQIVFEDISFEVSKDIRIGEVIKNIKNVSPYIYKVELGEDPRYMCDIKTILLKLSFHSSENKLSAKDTDPIKNEVIRMLEDNYFATLR